MTGNRGIGHLVCGRRAKWVVLGLWLVLLFVVAPFATKLTDAQDNDAASWLPGSAESTQVLEISEGFRPEQIPAVVVYARESGLTAEDRARLNVGIERILQKRDRPDTLRDVCASLAKCIERGRHHTGGALA